MSEWTPTTTQVRDGYRFDPEDDYRDPINAPMRANEAGRAFDRWLAAEKAKWQAEGAKALGSLLVDISRVTVVTDEGRAYESAYDAFDGIEIHIQDDGRTLKVLPAREKGSNDGR